MPVLHKIKAHLYDNVLTPDSNNFIARTVSERSLNVKQICEMAVSRGGADVSAPAMEHAVALFLKEMAYQLCDGYSVNTGYFTANAQIRGVFSSATEPYDPKKHSLLFQFGQGEKLRAEIPGIEISILGIAQSDAIILEVKDVKSGAVNDLLTPGKNLRIKGSKIKIAGTHASVGLFFVETSTGMRLPVDPSDMVLNNPSELIVMIPALPAGNYRIEVVTQYAGGVLLKEPRTASLDKILTVQ
jgi:hypothetical protein